MIDEKVIQKVYNRRENFDFKKVFYSELERYGLK